MAGNRDSTGDYLRPRTIFYFIIHFIIHTIMHDIIQQSTVETSQMEVLTDISFVPIKNNFVQTIIVLNGITPVSMIFLCMLS